MENQDSLPAWDRPHWSASGKDAFLLYAIFGDFAQPPRLSLSEYRAKGLPEGVELRAFSRDTQGEQVSSFYAGWFSRKLRAENPALFAAVERAPMCLLLRGSVPDPASLLYLRDAVGLLMALLDNGGVALLDSQALAWFSPSAWRERIYAPDAPVPTQHVTILIPEGQAIRMAGLPEGLVCHHQGDHDDPDFNNRHIEVRMAGK